jgi:hypothetical protein
MMVVLLVALKVEMSVAPSVESMAQKLVDCWAA